MLPDQTITISFPEIAGCPDRETTWAFFVGENDADTVAEVERQLVADHCAELGGGAAPLCWIFC